MIKKYSFLFIVIAAILWSIDGLLRRSLYSLSPAVVIFYEHLIGLILLLPFLLRQLNQLRFLTRKQLLAFIWVALLSGVLGTIMYTAALGQIKYIQFSVVVLLQQLQPLFVIVFARKVLSERITSQYVKWIIPALVSVYLISFPKFTINLVNDHGQIVAALLAIGSAFAWGSSTAFSRFTLQQFSPLLTTGIRFGLTIPIAFIFVILTNSAGQLTSLTKEQLFTLVIIALSTGMVALLFYYRGLKFTEAKVSAIAELTWPLSAVFIGFYFFHERLTLTQIIGAAMLLISMYKIGMLQKKA